MELLSQLDVQNPDHVSVITREGRVIISVRKDGADVTVGFPINAQVFDTKPRFPLQQPMLVQKTTEGGTDVLTLAERRVMRDKVKRSAARFHPKLTEATARQIKDMLKDKSILAKFRSMNQAYVQIGQAYGVSQHTVRQIHLGNAWKNV